MPISKDVTTQELDKLHTQIRAVNSLSELLCRMLSDLHVLLRAVEPQKEAAAPDTNSYYRGRRWAERDERYRQ